MKEIVINESSLHYKVANFYGKLADRRPHDDLCSYMSDVAKGMVLCAIITLIFTFVAFLFVHFLLGIYFSILTGTFLFTEPGIAFGVLLTALLFLYLFTTAASSMSGNGFVSSAYDSIKHKYCMRIKFKRKGDN